MNKYSPVAAVFRPLPVSVRSRPVESHSGTGGNILVGPLRMKRKKKFLNFKIAHSDVLATTRFPNVAGPRVAYLPYSPSLSHPLFFRRAGEILA